MNENLTGAPVGHQDSGSVVKHEGHVKWFSTEKGFGFISVPGGVLDIFVHANQLRKSGISRCLVKGEKVQFTIATGPKGNFAMNITTNKGEVSNGG